MSSCVPGTVYSIGKWIEENKHLFLPPVCNKMMHNLGQMKCFFVGGPNQRKDFHLECGEELFYMRKGDMLLKVVEKGKHRDIPIKEGQMFLLPSRIPHSPQRQSDTVGFVLERERSNNEKDALRYFVEEDGVMTTDLLYEDWFYCDDLGSLGPIVKKFFTTEQSKTGKPVPGSFVENRPIIVDGDRDLGDPINFQQWLDEHKEDIDRCGRLRVYPETNQFQISVYGKGSGTDSCVNAEIWIWQLEGSSDISYGEVKKTLNKEDSILIPCGERFTLDQEKGSYALVCYQDPSKSLSWSKK